MTEAELDREMHRKWDLIPRQSGPLYERLRKALIDHPANLRLTESVSQALHVIVAEMQTELKELLALAVEGCIEQGLAFSVNDDGTCDTNDYKGTVKVYSFDEDGLQDLLDDFAA